MEGIPSVIPSKKDQRIRIVAAGDLGVIRSEFRGRNAKNMKQIAVIIVRQVYILYRDNVRIRKVIK